MAETWYSQLESTIFTIIQYNLKVKPEAKYPGLKCTTALRTEVPSEFPTLYLHELSPLERGQDMENDIINSILYTVEIQVFSNKSETEVKNIMSTVIAEMKKLRFSVLLFPDAITNNKVSSAVARFRRTISKDDAL